MQRNRRLEISSLGDWVSLLGSRETARWLITVVAKADLWWDRREEVLQYYQAGRYHSALGEAQELHPVVLEYCSVLHRFYGEGRLSGLFDDSDRVRLRAHLLSELLTAVSKGK